MRAQTGSESHLNFLRIGREHRSWLGTELLTYSESGLDISPEAHVELAAKMDSEVGVGARSKYGSKS